MKQCIYYYAILFSVMTLCYGAGNVGSSEVKDKSSKQGHDGDTESTKLIRVGYPLVLKCDIANREGTVSPVEWMKNKTLIPEKDPHVTIFNENATLMIEKTTKEDVGHYMCETSTKQSQNFTVVYLSFKSMPKSVTVLEGDKLALTCEVEGIPMPIITWTKDGKDVEDAVNASRYVLETNEKGTENSIYVVEKADYIDKGNYACVIKSNDIQYNTTTHVRVKDMYAALWPFFGIVAEVFILCLIIFIYEKRKAKADFEESDTDQPTEQKNTCDQNKDSVRQRK